MAIPVALMIARRIRESGPVQAPEPRKTPVTRKSPLVVWTLILLVAALMVVLFSIGTALALLGNLAITLGLGAVAFAVLSLREDR